MKTVDYYFDYLSPWAYFSWLKLKPLVQERKIQLILHPVPYPKLSEAFQQRAVATLPPKRECIFKFAIRYALKNNLPFEIPKYHPFRPYLALRLSLNSVAGEKQAELVDLLFKACWKEQVHLENENEVLTTLNESGFDGESLLEKAKSIEAKKELTNETNIAIGRGVFGVPTFIADGELFWGNDQLEYLMDFLDGKDVLQVFYSKEKPLLPPHSWGLGNEKRPAKGEGIEINGIAHIALNVNRLRTCRPFYESLLSFMGLKPVFRGEKMIYYIGGRTAIAVGEADEKYIHEKFIQNRIGLHHLCFRARSRNEIDKLYEHLRKINAKIVHPPEEGPWAPGYYSVLFEDPDGIRLEANYVPGKGVFKEGVKFNPASDYY